MKSKLYQFKTNFFWKNCLTAVFLYDKVEDALLCRIVPKGIIMPKTGLSEIVYIYIERTGVKRQWRKTGYDQSKAAKAFV